MSISEESLNLLNAARLKVVRLLVVKISLLLALLTGIAFMMAENLSIIGFAFLSCVLCVFAIFAQQLTPGPNYEVLVAELTRQMEEQREGSQQD
ncbi:MAG: hypothetical protein DHS20C12_29500 [Pseudohongiella sp.]|nr:MAG: hypothetical protein DHS20C12_29500 [Pseudohongiella sp.]